MNKLKTYVIRVCYKYLLRPLLFLLEPEFVHNSFIFIGKILGKYRLTKSVTKVLFSYHRHDLEQTILGISFKNPVGLAAGFDKDANLVNIVEDVGFGFTQVGTITTNPYGGNPKPRLYRLPLSKGAVVYYGLKNIGVQAIINKLKLSLSKKIPLGISIGKTTSPETVDTEKGMEDYYRCLKKIINSNIGDFYIINISCPNAFGGEPFTTPERLAQLLESVATIKKNKPLFLKMPINTKWEDFKELLKVVIKYKINGVIIGNLNKNHKDQSIKDKIPLQIKGGISGKPTWKLSNDLIAKTYKNYGDRLVIIGVGGIFSAKDAYIKINLGASLVALITGLVYEGPQLVGEINKGLVELLKLDGFNYIHEAIGAYYKQKEL